MSETWKREPMKVSESRARGRVISKTKSRRTTKKKFVSRIQKARKARLNAAQQRVLEAAESWYRTVHLSDGGGMASLATRHAAEIELDVAVLTWRALR